MTGGRSSNCSNTLTRWQGNRCCQSRFQRKKYQLLDMTRLVGAWTSSLEMAPRTNTLIPQLWTTQSLTAKRWRKRKKRRRRKDLRALVKLLDRVHRFPRSRATNQCIRLKRIRGNKRKNLLLPAPINKVTNLCSRCNNDFPSINNNSLNRT
jgi:hypothetical protein